MSFLEVCELESIVTLRKQRLRLADHRMTTECTHSQANETRGKSVVHSVTQSM